MKKNYLYIWTELVIIVVFTTSIFVPYIANAKYTLNNAKTNLEKSQEGTGIAKVTVEAVSASVIKSAFLLIGLLFFILLFYGGMTLIFSRGDDTKVTKARSTITAAIIGLVVVLLAYAITAFISVIL